MGVEAHPLDGKSASAVADALAAADLLRRLAQCTGTKLRVCMV